MNLRDIANKTRCYVEYSPSGPKGDQCPCEICGRGLNPNASIEIWVNSRNDDLIPFDGQEPDHGEHGILYIGKSCYKKHASKLKGYVRPAQVEVSA
jgi:hypothetical protein